MDYYSYITAITCLGVKRPLEAKINELEQKIKGLELTDGISSS